MVFYCSIFAKQWFGQFSTHQKTTIFSSEPYPQAALAVTPDNLMVITDAGILLLAQIICSTLEKR